MPNEDSQSPAAPKSLEIRITELENAVRQLTDTIVQVELAMQCSPGMPPSATQCPPGMPPSSTQCPPGPPPPTQCRPDVSLSQTQRGPGSMWTLPLHQPMPAVSAAAQYQPVQGQPAISITIYIQCQPAQSQSPASQPPPESEPGKSF